MWVGAGFVIKLPLQSITYLINPPLQLSAIINLNLAEAIALLYLNALKCQILKFRKLCPRQDLQQIRIEYVI